ncbi:uncharacterized protein LOC111279831 [Durio zibethinus]|uniref:Uncharacterized protein LOC111279831 n=1 Tax=Durio zibethinus TaxID=66656 RepID=A0A6P5X2K7_DURZI|nr:uncharacterized protein LOC111279831 [Durio zibethinus]
MAMNRNAITTAILLFLIFADVSNASLFWKLRYLRINLHQRTTPPPQRCPSPLPSPSLGSGAKKSDSPSKLDPKFLNRTDSVTPLPDDKKDPTLSDKTEKESPAPENEIDSGNNSSLTSNSKNDKTMKDTEEKKKYIYSGKNPKSTEPEKQRRIRIRRRQMGMKVVPSQGLRKRVMA